jgi:signal peptidase II
LNWSPKTIIFWPTFVALWAADYGTKRLAETYLVPAHTPHSVIGNVVRFTLAHNPGAAMNMSLGQYSRVGFSLLTVLALVACWRFYRRSPPAARLNALAIALIAAGAVGNLTDRLRSHVGVVDFIDVGIGPVRFWTFNVADASLSCGAVLLAFLLSRESRGRPEP